MNTKTRNSNFELLRIVLMFFIVTYHFLVYIYHVENKDTNVIFEALWLPLHISVICFVLISGYFHIKPTTKGAVKLLLPLVVYYLIPCILLGSIYHLPEVGYQTVFFFSKSPYWFIRTYFYLFLISPLLNMYLDGSSFKEKIYLLIVLAFISVYMAIMGDVSVTGGKNVVLFMLIYVIGDIIKDKQVLLMKPNKVLLIATWGILNVSLVVVSVFFEDTFLGKMIWMTSFAYCSPILIINATLFFIIFMRFSFRSKFINHLSQSVFATYILTEHSLIKPYLLQPALSYIYENFSIPGGVVVGVMLFSILVLFCCCLIDNIFQPFFKWVQIVMSNKTSIKQTP